MELFSTMDTEALHKRLDAFGPAPCVYYPLARLWQAMTVEEMAQRLHETQQMISRLEEAVVSLEAQLIAAGVES